MLRDTLDLGLTLRFATAAVILGLGLAREARAQNAVLFAPDVTARLGTALSTTVDDDDVAIDDGAGSVHAFPAALNAAIPAGVEIAAIDGDSSGRWWIVLDTTAQLPGLAATSPATPLQVLRWRPATSDFVVVLDVVVETGPSFPLEARIDALAVRSSGDLFLSFDIPVAIPNRFTCDDEDLVAFNFGSSSWSLAYDGSANGVAEGLDLDAVAVMSDPQSNPQLISFDGSGTVGGVSFDDEDVLAYDAVAQTYTKYFDGSTSDPTNWPSADLTALPEPAPGLWLAAGLTLLHRLGRPRPPRA